MPRPHPPEVRDRALRMHADGTKPADIARALKVSESTVSTWVVRAKQGPRVKLAVNRPVIIAALEAGTSIPLVSVTHGVHADTLRSWVRKYDIVPVIPEHVRTKVLRAHDLMPSLTAGDLARHFGLSSTAVRRLLADEDAVLAYTGGWRRGPGGVLKPVPKKKVA